MVEDGEAKKQVSLSRHVTINWNEGSCGTVEGEHKDHDVTREKVRYADARISFAFEVGAGLTIRAEHCEPGPFLLY